jgi:hypothetical protein
MTPGTVPQDAATRIDAAGPTSKLSGENAYIGQSSVLLRAR